MSNRVQWVLCVPHLADLNRELLAPALEFLLEEVLKATRQTRPT
jgi:hypothetical protein